MNWYLMVLKKYATFRGRSRRAEYWMFVLFNFIFSVALMVLDVVLTNTITDKESGILYILYGLAVLVPTWAVMVRRLHDVGKSAWYLFFILIPFFGAIMILIKLCTNGNPGENKYGANPKEAATACQSEIKEDKSINICDKQLLEASAVGDFDHLKTCLFAGANINTIDEKGYTPLMHASEHGHVEIVKLLIANKANLSLLNKDNFNATDLAKQKTQFTNYKDIVTLLNNAKHKIYSVFNKEDYDLNLKEFKPNIRSESGNNSSSNMIQDGYLKFRSVQPLNRRKASNVDGALHQLAPAIETNLNQGNQKMPNDKEFYLRQSEKYWYQRNWEKSLESINEAIDLDPQNADYFIRRGNIYDAMDENRKALNDFLKAIECDPKCVNAYINAANYYYMTSDYASACSLYEKALQLNPNLPIFVSVNYDSSKQRSVR